MASLSIKNFSCIDEAEVNLAKLMVIIGPQASGKSVISKLLFFMYETVSDVFDTWESDVNLEDYTQLVIDRFIKSFPPSAWGSSAFEIKFSAGPVEVVVTRAKPRKSGAGKLRITFSEHLCAEYDRVRAEVVHARQTLKENDSALSFRRWEVAFKVQDEALERLKIAMGDDFAAAQLFIPAGRSFFTNMGKAVLAFEQGGFLDPLTINFGKRFLSYREDHDARVIYPSRRAVAKETELLRSRITKDLFSGDIVLEKNDPYVKAEDGRKIPFSVLSSGQQELLPLWLTLNGFMDHGPKSKLIYIEEPEAHLFPSAQGQLAVYLSQLLSSEKETRMLITSHSPYMLTVINNLLKAGSVGFGKSRKRQAKVEDVVAKSEWLKASETVAYAIIGRRVHSILHEDGLIDAEYLDEVSGKIGNDFMDLLEIEIER